MNIKDKFLELTSRTYPHGTEKDMYPLNDLLAVDEFGNLFVEIGKSDIMFTAHLDTATSAMTEITHVIDGDEIKTDGKSILGADDKAGVTIMLYMIEKNIPGLYYFFVGEEVGCIGSKKVADKFKETRKDIKKVVAFDRRGLTSVITFQSGKRCCSTKFGEDLAEKLNKLDDAFSYKTDDGGSITDSIQFISIYPECTNISVGYYSEHTFSERQNIEHLEKLAIACTKLDWASLPIERDPSKTEYKYYGYGSSYGYGREYWDDYDYYGRYSGYAAADAVSTYKPTDPITTVPNSAAYGYGRTAKPKTDDIWFIDKEFKHVSKVVLNNFTKKVVSVELDPDRIEKEKVMISDLMKALDIDCVELTWDGFNLKLVYSGAAGGHSSTADRNDMIEYLKELDYKNMIEEEDIANDTKYTEYQLV